jgi:hypothetical protein
VSSIRAVPLLRVAAAGALIACLGLAGCGRKGPLDPPPTAATGEAKPAGPSLVNPIASPIGSQPSASNPGVGPDGRPLAPKGEDKPFILDPLLN